MAIDDVKLARAQHLSTIVETLEKRFRLELGENEVALVHKIIFNVDLFAVATAVKIGVYRKTKGDLNSNIGIRDEVVDDDNWIAWSSYDTGLAAFTGTMAFKDDINFSPPLVLVRAPRLVLRNLDAESAAALCTIYYSIKTVDKKNLAQLLMKYHA